MKNSLLLIVILVLAGCSKKAMDAAEFCQWVNTPESGLITSKEINGLQYTAMYRPAAFMVLQQAGRQVSPDGAAFHEKLAEASGSQYFVLEIRSVTNSDVIAVNATSKEAYHARIIFLSYRVQERIRLIDGTDTLYCRLAQFEQMYTAAPYARINLVFDVADDNSNAKTVRPQEVRGDKTLLFDDMVWGNGLIKLRIKEKDLQNMPEVRI